MNCLIVVYGLAADARRAFVADWLRHGDVVVTRHPDGADVVVCVHSDGTHLVTKGVL